MLKKSLSFLLAVFLFAPFAKAQQAEVLIQLNEQFFDALLTAVFRDEKSLEFPIAEVAPKDEKQAPDSFGFSNFAEKNSLVNNSKCNETIKILREISETKTSVQFRNGKIFAPIAFTGSYNPPLIGCVDFSGVAETNIELEFDKNSQTLFGRAKVQNVNLSGSRGIGGSLVARFVQGSINKKINPINILQTERVSFAVPIQNAGTVQMKAVGMRHEVVNGALNVYVSYQFQ